MSIPEDEIIKIKQIEDFDRSRRVEKAFDNFINNDFRHLEKKVARIDATQKISVALLLIILARLLVL